MRFSTPTTLSLLAILSPSMVSARIYGLSAPSTVQPGVPFQVSLLTQDFIQSVQDVAVAFGISPGTASTHGSLGVLLGSNYIGPAGSNVVTPLNYTVEVAQDTAKGPAVLTASVMSLLGVGYGPDLENFNVTVTIGDATSTETVSQTI